MAGGEGATAGPTNEPASRPARPRRLLAYSEPLSSLAPEWEALVRSLPHGRGPFVTPRWHAAWLRHFPPEGDTVFVAFRPAARGSAGEDDDAANPPPPPLMGVAALDFTRDTARELGDPDIRDLAGPLAVPGYEHALAETLLLFVAEDGVRRLELWGIRDDDPMRPALTGVAEATGWAVVETVEAVTPAVDLPRDWKAFVAALGKHDRHELRRKLRHLDAAGAVSYAETAASGDVPAATDRLCAAMRASHDAKAAFLSPAMEAFFRDLAATFAADRSARLGTLALEGMPVAELFLFADASVRYLYNSGYDPAHAHLAVGLLSKAYAIRQAIADGATRFDFLRGDEDYKRHLGGRPVAIYRLAFTRR